MFLLSSGLPLLTNSKNTALWPHYGVYFLPLSNSLRHNLNPPLLGVRIEKSLYVPRWPSSKIWSGMANILGFRNQFCVSGVILRCWNTQKKVPLSFIIISCAASSIWKFISKMWAEVFWNTILKLKQAK